MITNVCNTIFPLIVADAAIGLLGGANTGKVSCKKLRLGIGLYINTKNLRNDEIRKVFCCIHPKHRNCRKNTRVFKVNCTEMIDNLHALRMNIRPIEHITADRRYRRICEKML